LDGDVRAGDGVGTLNLDGTALGTVFFGALPIHEGEIGKLDTVAVSFVHAAPVAVDVEGVGVAVTWIVSLKSFISVSFGLPMKFSKTAFETVPLPPLLLIMYIWLDFQV